MLRLREGVSRRARPRRSNLPPVVRGLLIGLIGLVLAVGVLAHLGELQRAVQAATSFTVENVGGQIGLGSADLKQTVIRVLRWILGILALVALAFIIYGGVLWMLARGNEQQIEKAKKVITSAVIGMIIIILSWAIVQFVVGTTANLTNADDGNTADEPGPDCFGLGCSREFAIRAITTSCATPSQPYTDVYRCSSVVISFNQRVQAASVARLFDADAPVPDEDKLVIEKCANDTCTAMADPLMPAPIDSQVYSGTSPQGIEAAPKAEWVTPQIRGKPANSIVFYHKYRLFEAGTTYRLRIPKVIRSAGSGNRALKECVQSDGSPVPGDCTDAGHDQYFTWRFTVGNLVDNVAPTVEKTYPTSAYKTDSDARPDRDVPRRRTIVARFSETIDPDTVRQDQPFDKDNAVVLYKMTAPPDPVTGLGGSFDADAPLDADTFSVLPSEDNRGVEIVLNDNVLFEPYTWYKVVIQKIEDQCQNPMVAYDFVFETNSVVPGVAEVYPANGYEYACPDTDVEIRYTVSMYDRDNHSCLVDPADNGGYVREGKLKNTTSGVFSGRSLTVADIVPGPDADPDRYCRRYEFTPIDTQLNTNADYGVGVNSRYVLNDAGDRLNFGDLADNPRAGLVNDPAAVDWHFKVKEPSQCANAPRIVKLRPPHGFKGQCFTAIGRGFSATKDPGDKLTFGGDELSVDSWSNRNIVTTAPDKPAGVYDVQVTVDHPAPIGPLASTVTDDSRFTIDDGEDASNGPCLLSVNPDEGEVTTLTDLRGKRLISDPIRKVLFDGYTVPDADGDFSIPSPTARWTSTAIPDAEIVDGSNVGSWEMRVKNSAGISNALDFQVLPTIPGQPRVSRYWPRPCAGGVCINAAIGAQFNLQMLEGSFTIASVELRKCNNADCTDLGGQLLTGAPAYTESGTIYEISMDDHPALEPDASYRVIIVGSGPSAVTSLSGQPLRAASLNYDRDGDSTRDSFSWTFKIKNDATLCSVASVGIAPLGPTTLRINQTLGVKSSARGSPSSCEAGGERLNPAAYDWNWTSTIETNVSVTRYKDRMLPLDKFDPKQIATGLLPTPGERIRTTEPVSGFWAETVVKVSEDLAFCNTTRDCTVNENADDCDSTCVSNRCTPVINRYTPVLGATPQSLVTVAGCWFGAYVEGTSLMTFLGTAAPGDDKDGLPPPERCDAAPGTWKNTYVVRELPVGAVTGPIRITRGDNRFDTTDGPAQPPSATLPGANPVLPDFTVNAGAPGPGLCKLDPRAERVDRPVSAIGTFLDPDGSGRDAGDKVTFSVNKDVDPVAYTSWTDERVGVKVPAGSETGAVVLTRGGVLSNELPFRVVGGGGGPSGGACTQTCEDDAICAAVPDTRCSPTRHCCSPWPFVSAQAPEGAGICRNVVIRVTFGGARIRPETVTNAVALVRLPPGPIPPDFDFRTAAQPITVTATSTGLRIFPRAALLQNAQYRVFITNGITSVDGVSLGQLNAVYPSAGPEDNSYAWDFSTGTTLCQIDRVLVDPSSHTFYKIEGEGDGSFYDFQAVAKSGAEEVQSVPGYAWDWDWRLSQAGVVTIPAGSTPTKRATAQADGQTLLTAAAVPKTPPDGYTGSRSGSASLRVLHCDDIWGPDTNGNPIISDETGTFVDQTGNCSLDPADCKNYFFSTTYCRDNPGGQSLPNLQKVFIQGASGNYKKQFFFSEPELPAEPGAKRDAVGIRVYSNDEGLSPTEWLDRNLSGEGAGGQSTVFEGYPAYRLGTTLYVAATNYTPEASSCVNVEANGDFENWTGALPTSWNVANGVVQKETTPAFVANGAASVKIDAAAAPAAARQIYLWQDKPPSTTNHRYRVTGYVRVEKVRHVAGKLAGLITQCNPPDLCWTVEGSYDKHGTVPGLFASNATASLPLPWDSGWRKIDFTVSNAAGLNVGLRLNCLAEPGWRTWCDNITVTELTSACAGGTLRQNMYLMSVNPDAKPATRTIFSQMMKNWELNINPELTAEDRAAMARDSARLNDLQSIKKKLEAYKSRTGTYPELIGGTFTPNVSTSIWGSWNATLGNALGSSLPTDPRNSFDPPCDPSNPDLDRNTCWNLRERKFICPSNSHLYGYQFIYGRCNVDPGVKCAKDSVCPIDSCTGGVCSRNGAVTCTSDNDCQKCNNPAPSYRLGANLEYEGPASPRLDPACYPELDLCGNSPPSQCSCFSYAVPALSDRACP